MVAVEAEGEEWLAPLAIRRDIRARRDKIRQGSGSSTRLGAVAGTAAVAEPSRPAAYTGLDMGKQARDRNTIGPLQSTTSQTDGDTTRDSSDLRARRRNHVWENP